jgi:hypothetical protein
MDFWGEPSVSEQRRPLLESLVQAGACGPLTPAEVEHILTDGESCGKEATTENRWIELKSFTFAIDLYLHELSGDRGVLRFIGSHSRVKNINARANIILDILKGLQTKEQKGQ